MIAIHRLQVGGQAVEVAVPEFAVVLEPYGGSLERLGVEMAGPPLRLAAARNETGVFEHLEVLRNRRKAHVVRLGEFGDRRITDRQARKNAAARRIGEGCKRGTEGICRHFYSTNGLSTNWLNSARDEESQARPKILAPVGQRGGIEIFVQAGDMAFAYLADDAGGKRNLFAVGELALEKMLLDEAAFEDLEPAARVMALRHVSDEALERLEILVGRDRGAIMVVPDDCVRRVDGAHRFEVAALDCVEETLRQLARRFVWHACLLQPP